MFFILIDGMHYLQHNILKKIMPSIPHLTQSNGDKSVIIVLIYIEYIKIQAAGREHAGTWGCLINFLKVNFGVRFIEFQRPDCFSSLLSHGISLMSLKFSCGYKASLVIFPALKWPVWCV